MTTSIPRCAWRLSSMSEGWAGCMHDHLFGRCSPTARGQAMAGIRLRYLKTAFRFLSPQTTGFPLAEAILLKGSRSLGRAGRFFSLGDPLK